MVGGGDGLWEARLAPMLAEPGEIAAEITQSCGGKLSIKKGGAGYPVAAPKSKSGLIFSGDPSFVSGDLANQRIQVFRLTL
jgi:hypothetical protein